MKRVIGVISGKGGVGKTTLSVNLGMAMHRLGEDVFVVDTDLKNPNVALHLGVFDFDNTVQDVLDKDLPLIEALYIHPTGLKFAPAHISLRYLNVDSDRLRRAFSEVYTTTLVDAPPGFSKETLSVLDVVDEVIVMTTPDLPSVTGALRAVDVAKSLGVNVTGMVVNASRGRGYEINQAELEAVSGTKILGQVPWDETIPRGIALKTPAVQYNPFAPASQAFFHMASKLTGREYNPPGMVGFRNLMNTLGRVLKTE